MTASATISFGKQIKATGAHSLQRISLYDVFEAISKSDAPLKDLCARLRQTARINPDAYRVMKTSLPFFCGSTFVQDHRKTEHFEAAHYCIIDIDHCYENEVQFASLKARLCADESVALLFTSPGGEGLKVVFQLDEPMMSTKRYSDFYAVFSRAFAERHDLVKHVDFVTRDATRVCFLSADEQAYFNPLCEPVCVRNYVSAFDILERTGNTTEALNEVETAPTSEKAPITPDVYADIRNKLKPGTPQLRQKQIFVPEILESVIGPIEDYLVKLGLVITDVRDINYGKQICIAFQQAEGEVNLYYGKHGFSVVQTTKSGMNAELNGLLARAVENVVYSIVNPQIPSMDVLPGAAGDGQFQHNAENG